MEQEKLIKLICVLLDKIEQLETDIYFKELEIKNLNKKKEGTTNA